MCHFLCVNKDVVITRSCMPGYGNFLCLEALGSCHNKIRSKYKTIIVRIELVKRKIKYQ